MKVIRTCRLFLILVEKHEGAMSPYTLRFLGKDLEALYLRHSSGTRGALAVSTNPHPTHL